MKKIDLKAAVQQKAEPTIVPDLTFSELVRAFCASNLNVDIYSLRKWTDAFGDESAWGIESSKLDMAGEAMLDAGYKASTVNRNLSLIGSMYRWAKKRRMTPAGFISPTLHLTRYEEAVREVKLSADQLQRILDATHQIKDRRFSVLIHILAESGARLSEVAERHWRDVDLDRCEILVERTKTGVSRVLHFSEQTAQLMRRIWPQRQPDCLLFASVRSPGKPTNYRKSWKQVTEAAGIPGLRLHDLRHYRAKELLASGVTIGVASQALGHSSLILQRRYGHLETHTTKSALERSWT